MACATCLLQFLKGHIWRSRLWLKVFLKLHLQLNFKLYIFFIHASLINKIFCEIAPVWKAKCDLIRFWSHCKFIGGQNLVKNIIVKLFYEMTENVTLFLRLNQNGTTHCHWFFFNNYLKYNMRKLMTISCLSLVW